MDKLFNRGVAVGEAFCNRVDELDRLLKNIHALTHTLLISPRRYGKTSLSLRTIEKSELPFVYIDLFMKYQTDELLDEFYQGIGALITKLIKPTEKAIRKIESILKNVSVSLKLGAVGFELSLSPKTTDTKRNIKYLLTSLDELLAKYNKRAVFFIDEIQTISESEMCAEIESALRFVAQKSNHLVFIFSGSSRHLIGKIFDDRSRPLYKLCQRIALQRISSHHYQDFINKFAQRKWRSNLEQDVLEEIFLHTQLHPYYINILCSYLFELSHSPSIGDVTVCWQRICQEEQASVAKDIEFLTQKQKQLLREIARHPELKEPTGKDFMKNVAFSARGVSSAIKILLKHDIVEKLDSSEIRVVDPALQYWACHG